MLLNRWFIYYSWEEAYFTADLIVCLDVVWNIIYDVYMNSYNNWDVFVYLFTCLKKKLRTDKMHVILFSVPLI